MLQGKRKILIISILILVIVSLVGLGAYYWYENINYISTEDARIAGDIVKVSPQISGKLLEFDVQEGDRVIKDQILGRQEMINMSDSNIDTAVIRSPINGTVIKAQGQVNEMVVTGQTLAYVVDPDKLHISANIEETKVSKLIEGQIVDITIDEYPDVKFTGKVKSIGLAANSTFSLFSTTSGGTFTKTVQRVPVKIEFDKGKYQLLPGTNAVIKIHIT